MLRGSVNPYDELVAKATDENLTEENWELILNLCDKVYDEGPNGARNAIAAVLKRLSHRNPNVQLYSLGLAECLSKNCGIEVNREIASRSFTTGLERLVTNRTVHDKIKKRALALIQQWSGEFHEDPTLSIMEELYQSLKAKNYRFDPVIDAPPPEVDDRRQEEEELQRVLELTMHDKGGRNKWYSGGYTPQKSATAPSYGSSTHQHSAPGYPPAASQPKREPERKTTAPTVTAAPTVAPPAASTSPKPAIGEPVATRVRALHTFVPTELGELGFEKGDIIRVVDRNYKDWWRGQLKGKTGVFPVNYVEPLPEPTPADVAREAQMEVDVFSQAPNIDQLLTLLRSLDPVKDNLANNDELEELYRQSVSLRPKIVRLMDTYTQKRLELQAMSDNVKIAQQIFQAMMEESLAWYNPGGEDDFHEILSFRCLISPLL
ncbi:hypothetical protein M407DRAFT_67248 [Tulasnella calospora MUT 4182]|uniref:Class E vacuolar protein-sorting machinery protein HSE1 n=1 Tax=Tulasnella calospora MUT 4182 TaxID=1051891 RepID=A0A0C3QIR4_9AGAM|nr:hypothetical protein M407DRAFT_67248 [Tulasnella calospora MUT 4182]